MSEYITDSNHRRGRRHVDNIVEHGIDPADFLIHLIAAFRAFDPLAAEEAIAGATSFLCDYRGEDDRFLYRIQFHELCCRLADRRDKVFSPLQTYAATRPPRREWAN